MAQVRDEVLSIVRGENLTADETQGVADDSAPGMATSPTATVSAQPAAQIEPWLREVPRGPKCGAALSDGPGPRGTGLHCTNAECRLAYRVDDGIPVLLVDESRSLAD